MHRVLSYPEEVFLWQCMFSIKRRHPICSLTWRGRNVAIRMNTHYPKKKSINFVKRQSNQFVIRRDPVSRRLLRLQSRVPYSTCQKGNVGTGIARMVMSNGASTILVESVSLTLTLIVRRCVQLTMHRMLVVRLLSILPVLHIFRLAHCAYIMHSPQ